MSVLKRRLDSVYKHSDTLAFDDDSKFILMSDCHRGQGNNGDNFLPNQILYFGAMEHYYKHGFTYIELGDGDELWENRKIWPILETHSDCFWLMSKFYHENRLYMLYGNHDVVKKRKKKKYSHFYCESRECVMPLFPGIDMPEGLILRYTKAENGEILLVHGHQGSVINDLMWPVARFLIRYFWRPLELVGCTAPVGAARPHTRKEKIERKLSAYANESGRLLIAGHTHRPIYSKPGQGSYFNDGSCVHPRSITGIEIENGCISLVKWSVAVGEDRRLYVERSLLEGPCKLSEYF